MRSPFPPALAALTLLASACSGSPPGATDASPAPLDAAGADAGASLDAGQAGPDAAGSPLDASLPGADAGVADPFPEAFGVFAPFTDEFLPFRQSMGMSFPQYQDWVGARMNELGASWTRSNLQLFWDLVEPTVGGGYDWEASFGGDDVFAGAARHGVHYLGVFHEGSGPTSTKPARNPLDDLGAWTAFAKAAVERYDGDGVDDAPGGIAIKHWQLGNEIPAFTKTGRTAADYVTWFEAAAQAIREADPEARLVLTASLDGDQVDPFHETVIRALAADGVRFDAVDLHHWGHADLASSRMDAVPQYRALLASLGLGSVELWSGEHGTYLGKLTEGPFTCDPACDATLVCAAFGSCVPRCHADTDCPAQVPVCETGTGLCVHDNPEQTAVDQARSLVYRYVVNRAAGVKRILWNNLAGWRCFNGTCGGLFDRIGLVADGYGPGETAADVGEPRLAYFSYKMLSERTKNTVAEQLGALANADPAVSVYAYRSRATGKTGLVAWRDGAAAQASLDFAGAAARATSLVTDAAGAPTRDEALAVAAGKVSLSLDASPVWIAEP